MADALKAKTIDVAELCSTQPDIIVNGWVLLEDDKKTQPADNIAPLVRNDYLAKVDKAAFSKLLDDVSAKIDTADPGRPVQAGRRRQEGRSARGQGLAAVAGHRQVTDRSQPHGSNPRHRRGFIALRGSGG